MATHLNRRTAQRDGKWFNESQWEATLQVLIALAHEPQLAPNTELIKGLIKRAYRRSAKLRKRSTAAQLAFDHAQLVYAEGLGPPSMLIRAEDWDDCIHVLRIVSRVPERAPDLGLFMLLIKQVYRRARRQRRSDARLARQRDPLRRRAPIRRNPRTATETGIRRPQTAEIRFLDPPAVTRVRRAMSGPRPKYRERTWLDWLEALVLSD